MLKAPITSKPTGRPCGSKLSADELFEREHEGELGAQYWRKRLLEYRCAFANAEAMVDMLMNFEPVVRQFRCVRAYNKVRRAMLATTERKGDVDLLRLTVETIRRHLAASPTAEKLYKSLRKAGLSDFTGTAPKIKAANLGELSLEDAALRARLTQPTRRCKPAPHSA